jgi:hypothetical protein
MQVRCLQLLDAVLDVTEALADPDVEPTLAAFAAEVRGRLYRQPPTLVAVAATLRYCRQLADVLTELHDGALADPALPLHVRERVAEIKGRIRASDAVRPVPLSAERITADALARAARP